MSQLFGRSLRLLVGNDSNGLDFSQFEVEFTVRQWDLQTPNTATIRVFNVAPKTAQRVQQEFTRVVLEAGYEDGPKGTIFDGTLIQARRGKLNATDTYLDLHCADGDEAYCFALVQSSIAAGSTARQRLDAIAESMKAHGVAQGYVPDDLPDEKLPRGRVMFGMANSQMRSFAAWSGMKWSIQNGKLQLVPLTGVIPGDAVVLNSKTGLIGMPEQTQEGVSARCLLNPTIRMGARVQINEADVNQAPLQIGIQSQVQNSFLPTIATDGFYRVVVAQHVGQTRGQAWYTDMVCIALDAGLTPGLIAKGYA